MDNTMGINNMKKTKIFCIAMSVLMIVTAFPVIGQIIHPRETPLSTAAEPLNQPPGPAYAVTPSLDTLVDRSIESNHPEKTASTMDDIVIDIIEQVNESIFLSYEENLTANGPRPTGSPSCIAAAEYMYEQFQNMGLAVRYHHWSNGGYSSDNVEATLNGTDVTSDEIYIICAHYDTVSAGPGADDDTSGTAAVLIAALIMSQYQFNHTIKFVAFSGEEQGMLGSEVYADEAANQGWNIIGVLNCDMISYAITSNDGNNLIVFENTASEWLYSYTAGVNTEYNEYIQLTLHHGGSTWGSDHWYFWQNGYSALFYFEYTETPYYHTAQDTMEHINATYAVKNMRLIFATLAELAGAGLPSTPPEQPVLTGPDVGIVNEIYIFSAVTTDPDGDELYYLFDWGNGHDSGWLGPFASGDIANESYAWSVPGSYDVTVIAKDEYGVVSGMSPPHTIIINPSIQIGTITGGLFKVTAVIHNNGSDAVTNIPWWINLSGGVIPFGKTTKGTIPTIPAGGSVTISSGVILGFGKTVVAVTTDAATKSQNAMVLLFFIKTM
jgi:hypothetical protein